MISHDNDPFLGRYGRAADALSFFAIVLSIIYLGLQAKLPGRHHYQDIAKDKSNTKADVFFFSSLMEDSMGNKKEPEKDFIVQDDVAGQKGSILNKFGFLKYILADQEINDDHPLKTTPCCQKSVPYFEKLDEEKVLPTADVKSSTDGGLFFKNMLADQSGLEKKKELSTGLIANLMNLLATEEDSDKKPKSTSPKSQKKDAKNSVLSSFSAFLADSDFLNDASGSKVKGKDSKSQNAESSKSETDDLLEAFKVFLKRYSAGRNKKFSGKDIKSEFKTFLSKKQKDTQGENIKYEAAFEKTENGAFSSILRSFLIDDDVFLEKDSILEDSEQEKPDRKDSSYFFDSFKGLLAEEGISQQNEIRKEYKSSKADSTIEKDQILDSIKLLLAEDAQEKKEAEKGKPAAEVVNILKGFLVDDQKGETFETKFKGKEESSKKDDKNKNDYIFDAFKGILVETNQENEKNRDRKFSRDEKIDPKEESNIFEGLLADEKKSNDDQKRALGAKIVFLFKDQMKKEKYSTTKNGKGPVKEFLDIFESFLADGNQADAVFEEVSTDDPFHLNIKSVLLTDEENSTGNFSNDIKKLSSYLKTFLHSDSKKRTKRRTPCEERYVEDENPIESFLTSILA